MDDSEPITPVSPEIGVVAMVPDTWGQSVWQVRHQVLTRLSHYFHVVWVNPPLGWRQALRESPWRSRFVAADPGRAPSLTIYDHSKWCAKFYRPKSMARRTEKARIRAAVAHLRSIGCKSIIGYLWRPQFANEYWLGQFDRRCYHIDDEYTFAANETPISDREYRIIERSDLVLIHSPAMMAKKGAINADTIYSPNGVDFEIYDRPYDTPDDLVRVNRPIVLYVGVLKSMLDWSLIEKLVDEFAELSFVFVGPEGTLTDEDKSVLNSVQRKPNTFFLGHKAPEQLPAYTVCSDVCILPYRINAYTQMIFPIKVNEYLAAGKPAIGTPITTLLQYGDVVEVADSTEKWIAAIKSCLQNGSEEEEVRKRKRVARNYDWNELVKQIAHHLRRVADDQR